MHDDTKRDLVDNTIGAIGAVVKDFVTYRREMNRKEKEFEMRKELEEAKAEAEAKAAIEGDTGREPALPGTQVGGSLDTAIDRLEQNNQCGVCQMLLKGIRDLDDPNRQAVALAEYGEFVGKIEEGASDDGLEAFLGDSDELGGLLDDVRAEQMA